MRKKDDKEQTQFLKRLGFYFLKKGKFFKLQFLNECDNVY